MNFAKSKAKLAGQLLASLDDPEQKAIDAAWAKEVERRIDELETGKATVIPADKVLRGLKSRKQR